MKSKYFELGGLRIDNKTLLVIASSFGVNILIYCCHSQQIYWLKDTSLGPLINADTVL